MPAPPGETGHPGLTKHQGILGGLAIPDNPNTVASCWDARPAPSWRDLRMWYNMVRCSISKGTRSVREGLRYGYSLADGSGCDVVQKGVRYPQGSSHNDTCPLFQPGPVPSKSHARAMEVGSRIRENSGSSVTLRNLGYEGDLEVLRSRSGPPRASSPGKRRPERAIGQNVGSHLETAK